MYYIIVYEYDWLQKQHKYLCVLKWSDNASVYQLQWWLKV